MVDIYDIYLNSLDSKMPRIKKGLCFKMPLFQNASESKCLGLKNASDSKCVRFRKKHKLSRFQKCLADLKCFGFKCLGFKMSTIQKMPRIQNVSDWKLPGIQNASDSKMPPIQNASNSKCLGSKCLIETQ